MQWDAVVRGERSRARADIGQELSLDGDQLRASLNAVRCLAMWGHACALEHHGHEQGYSTRLFHPRELGWDDHFEWRGTLLCGITASGRTTVGELQLNAERRQRIREAETVFGLFPPTD